MKKFLFSLLCVIPFACFSTPSYLSSLYATLDETSVAQHFAFYELYPKTEEGKKALKHAWRLLSGSCSECDPETILPSLNLQPIISLVNRSDLENAPTLNEESLKAIEKLSKGLKNRSLKGFHLTDEHTIINLPSEEIDLGRALLITEIGYSKENISQIRSYEASLDLMALQIMARLKPNASPLEKVRAMNDYIFAEMRFRFPPHSLYAKDIDVYTFLPSVLDKRRGVCLGVSLLYLCLSQRIGLELEAITPPGHIYVRYVDPLGKETNIETTARGIDVPSKHYLGIETKSLQKRSIKEAIGLAFMNQAAVYWHKENFEKAVFLYEKALPFLPNDPLLQFFLGCNYLFAEKKEKGRELFEKLSQESRLDKLFATTVVEDYLKGLTDAEAIQTVFSEVDETRESILEKQAKLKAVVQKYPFFRQGIFHLAVTWLQLGREKEALPILHKYQEIFAHDPTVNYYLAAIYLQRHHFNESWRYLKQAEAITKAQDYTPKALVDLRKELQRQCPEL